MSLIRLTDFVVVAAEEIAAARLCGNTVFVRLKSHRSSAETLEVWDEDRVLWRALMAAGETREKDPGGSRYADPGTLQHVAALQAALRDLVATIDLHTDCMTNTIDREALEPWLLAAEAVLGDAVVGR